LKTSIHMT